MALWSPVSPTCFLPLFQTSLSFLATTSAMPKERTMEEVLSKWKTYCSGRFVFLFLQLQIITNLHVNTCVTIFFKKISNETLEFIVREVCVPRSVPLNLPSAELKIPCGKRPGLDKRKGRIVNGYPATPGLIPWQVGVRKWTANMKYQGHHCGGTIINDYWILSAAHCYQ